MDYIKRIVDDEINDKLEIMGAIVIRGPKWCGKTTSAKQVANSILEMQNPDFKDNYLELAKIKPSSLLEGDKPRLIDEWQLAPKLWNAVRYAVDKSAIPGQYILTGSAVPVEDPDMHSGVGRFDFIEMKSMTLFESGESNGTVSLNDILNGKSDIDGKTTDFTYEKIAFALCRGGWPNSIKLEETQALKISKSYLKLLCESDISKIDGVKRNAKLARLIIKSYARQTSTIDSNQAMYDDVKANNIEVSERTIMDYIDVLKKLYVIDEIEAWNPNIRSKTAIRTSSKKGFVDPSIATAALGVSPKELILDVKTYGLLFENLVNRDLSVYVNKIGGYLNHYRDRYGLECDNVIHFDDGRYALVEVKLGGDKVKEAEEHLLELKGLIATNEKLKEPEFLMIITAEDLAYTTKSGVHIVPIGCLKD